MTPVPKGRRHFWAFGGDIIANGWGYFPNHAIERPSSLKASLQDQLDQAALPDAIRFLEAALSDLTEAMERACDWHRCAA